MMKYILIKIKRSNLGRAIIKFPLRKGDYHKGGHLHEGVVKIADCECALLFLKTTPLPQASRQADPPYGVNGFALPAKVEENRLKGEL